MTGTTPDQDPSIEEILASIRQIISDDDETREGGDIELPEEEAGRDSDLDLSAQEEDDSRGSDLDLSVKEEDVDSRESFADVLELTNEIKDEEEKVINYDEEEKFTIPVADPEPEEDESRDSDLDLSAMDDIGRDSDLDLSQEEENSTPMGADDIDALFTAPAAAATTEAFSKLMGNIPVEREENTRLYADGRITLEDIAKDLMRPMLRQWIDDNVPRLVERLVEKELEKLAKSARDD